MRLLRAYMAILFAGCGSYGTPDEKLRPDSVDPDCPEKPTLVLTIESYPTSNPVIADVDVIGTISGNSFDFVRQIRIGAVSDTGTSSAESKPVIITPAKVWNAVVPLELLLGANDAPGSVRLEAVAVNDCDLEVITQSERFEVAYPPPPMDAPTD